MHVCLTTSLPFSRLPLLHKMALQQLRRSTSAIRRLYKAISQGTKGPDSWCNPGTLMSSWKVGWSPHFVPCSPPAPPFFPRLTQLQSHWPFLCPRVPQALSPFKPFMLAAPWTWNAVPMAALLSSFLSQFKHHLL